MNFLLEEEKKYSIITILRKVDGVYKIDMDACKKVIEYIDFMSGIFCYLNKLKSERETRNFR